MKPVRPGHRREEVLNTLLVSELNSLGGLFVAEERGRGGAPDGNGSWYGMSVVIECKYDTERKARDELENQIKQRLDSGIAAVGIEVLYPSELRLSSRDPAKDLRSSTLNVRLRTREGDLTDWMNVAGVSGVAEKLDLARSFLVGGDAVVRSVEQLSEVVERLAKAIGRQPGHELEIVRLVTAADPVGLSTASTNIRETARKVSGLVIATALLMQHSLTDFDDYVPKLPSSGDLRIKLVESWRKVIDHDYRAVFLTALQILETLGDSELSLNQELKHAVEVTRQIVQRRVLGRHDLVGRIYHTLLTAQKYLATYYTKIPAAVILAGIVLHPSRWEEGKFDLERDFSFRLCDPAQGTGTLLSAALTEIRKYLIRENAGLNRDVDLRAISKRLIEEDIYGFDVLAYAVQVAAATLLLSSPGTTVDKSKLFQLSFGGPQGKLGSLEFLFGDGNETQGILFGALGSTVGIDTVFPDGGSKRTADVTGEISLQDVPLPLNLDLVIMNPPFTRSGGSSRLLGSLDAEEHSVGRERLGRLSSRLDGASVSAGLGAMFVPLAHKMLRDNGRMAVILPKTMLTGSQWQPTREFLARNYHLELVISSHDPMGGVFLTAQVSQSACLLHGSDCRAKNAALKRLCG